jgi:hypothetical protein
MNCVQKLGIAMTLFSGRFGDVRDENNYGSSRIGKVTVTIRGSVQALKGGRTSAICDFMALYKLIASILLTIMIIKKSAERSSRCNYGIDSRKRTMTSPKLYC